MNKVLDVVKKGNAHKLTDDGLADAVGELESKTWSKDNKDQVMKWVKSIEKEMKKRDMEGPKITPKFESKIREFLDGLGEKKIAISDAITLLNKVVGMRKDLEDSFKKLMGQDYKYFYSAFDHISEAVQQLSKVKL